MKLLKCARLRLNQAPARLAGDGVGVGLRTPAGGPSTLLANFLFSSSAMESLSFRSNCHGGMRTVSTISTRTNILRQYSGNRRACQVPGPASGGDAQAASVPSQPDKPGRQPGRAAEPGVPLADATLLSRRKLRPAHSVIRAPNQGPPRTAPRAPRAVATHQSHATSFPRSLSFRRTDQ